MHFKHSSIKASPTEDAKAELRLLKGLYRRLLETKDAGEKEKLRTQIMAKVEKIESILHKKKTLVTEEAVDYFTEDKINAVLESTPDEIEGSLGRSAMADTKLQKITATQNTERYVFFISPITCLYGLYVFGTIHFRTF